MTLGIPKRPPIRNDAFRQWIREQPCLLADREPCECGKYVHVGSRRMVTQACHVRSRGAGGGDPANLWPGCDTHHKEQHRIGIKSFERKYQLNLKQTADDLWAAYQSEWKEAA